MGEAKKKNGEIQKKKNFTHRANSSRLLIWAPFNMGYQRPLKVDADNPLS
jgi:hypothetical protein